MLTFPLNPSDPFSHPLILSQAVSHSLPHPHPHSHSHSHLSKTTGATATPPMLTSSTPLLTLPAQLLLAYLAGAAPFSTSLVFPPCLLHLATACRRCCSSLTSPGPPPPHKAATFSSPSFCSKNRSFCSKNQICNF